MRKLIIILLSVVFLSSCNKQNVNDGGNQVFVRIQNGTAATLENAIVATTEYGNVLTGVVTNYKALSVPIYAAYCRFTDAGIETAAGYLVCGTPMPASFEPGYYTFIIEPDASGYNGITVTRQ